MSYPYFQLLNYVVVNKTICIYNKFVIIFSKIRCAPLTHKAAAFIPINL